jgi:hypothetical protein
VTDAIPAEAGAPRFPCVCCGHLVFEGSVGSHEICPVCFWEDDLVQTRWPDCAGGANKPSLIECQRNYQRFGASEARVLRRVRPAAETEPVDEGWYPLGPEALSSFEASGDDTRPWRRDRTVLYWWRPTFWRSRPPRWTGWISAADLTDPANWSGGFYELAIELAGDGDAHLQHVLDALWSAAGIDGCYARPGGQNRFEDAAPTVAGLAEYGHLRATVLLPAGKRIVCSVHAVRGEDISTPWLVFCLPLGALVRTDKRIGGFPFGPAGGEVSLAWRLPLDDWLVDVARAIHRAVPVRLALVGFETSGDTDAASLGGRVPEQRFSGYLVPRGDRLEYTAANR